MMLDSSPFRAPGDRDSLPLASVLAGVTLQPPRDLLSAAAMHLRYLARLQLDFRR